MGSLYGKQNKRKKNYRSREYNFPRKRSLLDRISDNIDEKDVRVTKSGLKKASKNIFDAVDRLSEYKKKIRSTYEPGEYKRLSDRYKPRKYDRYGRR
jgi:hypothetical protein